MTEKYPEPLNMDFGCKITLMTYATEAEAKQCAEVAAVERDRLLAHGYDFGYSWPGNIRLNEDGTYTVVCP